jgi:pyruvate dehydrogenase E2 component (dihydrolipoamide acetyltransferase)
MDGGTLVEWLISPGDEVKRGDVVAVIETQKGAIEIECFEEGKVEALFVGTGEKLPVGTPLARISGPDDVTSENERESPIGPKLETKSQTLVGKPLVSAGPVPTVSGNADAIAASPAARRRANELGVNLGEIEGSFPGGRIVLSDVEMAAFGGPIRTTDCSPIPSDSMRQVIGAAMTRSKREIPHFYLSERIDVQPAMDWLATHNARVPPSDRLLLGAVFVRATVQAAQEVGVLNGHFLDDQFLPAQKVNVGVAVALRGGGLVAPALICAEAKTLAETMRGMRDLVSRARAGRLRNSEMTDATITVSSLGENGAEAMTGVIFPPQVAMVCLGAPQIRPWIVSGEIVPRQIITLTLSVDHRVSDGRQAARFIAAFNAAISDPEKL